MKRIVLPLCLVFASSLVAQVGIGTTNPQETLHVEGTFRLNDGNQAANRVLTTDANGTGTWANAGLTTVEGVFSTGVDIPASTSNFLQTGASITLPPGRYAVTITMLLIFEGAVTAPDNSHLWLRSILSDSSGANPTPTPDTVGAFYASGNMPASSRFEILRGTLVVNNTSGANKTYYYAAGFINSHNNNLTLDQFGGSNWDENTIVAYSLN